MGASGSFLSLLTNGHRIRNFSTITDAELYLYRSSAPSLAQNVTNAPDLDSAQDLCACIEWITWPNGVPYAALPDKAREVLHKLLGLQPNVTFNESALSWLRAIAPGRHDPPAPPGAAPSSSPAMAPLAAAGPSPSQYPSPTHIFPGQSDTYASSVSWGPGSGWGVCRKRPIESSGPCCRCLLRKKILKFRRQGLTDETALERLAESEGRCAELTSKLSEQTKCAEKAMAELSKQTERAEKAKARAEAATEKARRKAAEKAARDAGRRAATRR